MKNGTLLALGSSGLLILTGCACQLRLCAVDASSGTNISGVSVQVEHWGTTAYFYRNRHIREAGTTDPNGTIFVGSVGRRDMLFFQANGYRPVMVALRDKCQVSINWPSGPGEVLTESPPVGPWKEYGVASAKGSAAIAVPMCPDRPAK